MNLKTLLSLLAIVIGLNGASAGIYTGEGVVTDDEATEIICKEYATISDHMQTMGGLIRKLVESIQQPEGLVDDNEIAKTVRNVQLLRVHLTSVFNLTPAKVLSIDETDPQNAKLIFQGYLHKILGLTLQLESELIKRPQSYAAKTAQKVHIDHYITDIYETVAKAHALYRD